MSSKDSPELVALGVFFAVSPSIVDTCDSKLNKKRFCCSFSHSEKDSRVELFAWVSLLLGSEPWLESISHPEKRTVA